VDKVRRRVGRGRTYVHLLLIIIIIIIIIKISKLAVTTELLWNYKV
jgi:hypothetical protein